MVYDPDSIYVTSFPSGMKTYIVPKDIAEGNFGDITLTSKEYFVGKTPISTKLDPGEYRVNVVGEPLSFREDGENSKLFMLKNNNMIPFSKIYNIKKKSGEAYLLTALFWMKKQSLSEFIKLLPHKKLFEITDLDFFHRVFREHKIPSNNWQSLLFMLSRTGKAVWHGKNPKHYLYVYYRGPKTLIVDPVLPDSTAGGRKR